jgi:hypothetical protein
MIRQPAADLSLQSKRAQEESNLHFRVRSPVPCPLNDGRLVVAGSPAWSRTKISRVTIGRSALELQENEYATLYRLLPVLARCQPS